MAADGNSEEEVFAAVEQAGHSAVHCSDASLTDESARPQFGDAIIALIQTAPSPAAERQAAVSDLVQALDNNIEADVVLRLGLLETPTGPVPEAGGHDHRVRQRPARAVPGTLHVATVGIQRHLDTLEQAVKEGRSAWSGSARDAYDDAQRAWTTAMTTMRSILAQADTAAEASGQALTSADAVATKLWT